MNKITEELSVCLLCNQKKAYKIEFKQLYNQHRAPQLEMDWYECTFCKGWFNYPVPSTLQIGSYWKTVAYNNASNEKNYLNDKIGLYNKILDISEGNSGKRTILDFGSNFGQFLDISKQRGWETYGVEPFHDAAEISRKKEHIIFEDFDIENSIDENTKFHSIVAIDSFYYSWHPYATLKSFYTLLEYEGKLIMRVSNKRTIIGFLNSLIKNDIKKNNLISKILQAQFHSIEINELGNICKQIGFKKVEIIVGVNTTPFLRSSFNTNLAYHISTIIYYLTFKKLNLSPGVILIAEK